MRWLAIGIGFPALVLGCGQDAPKAGFEELPGGEGGYGGTTPVGGSGGTGTPAGGQGGAGATGGTAGSGGYVIPCDFSPPNTCPDGQLIQQVRGDDGSDVRVETGVGAMWFRIYVEESVSSLTDYPPLSYTAELQSPPGMDYDLYVYRGNDVDPNCNATPSSSSGGNPETISQSWEDNAGVEDGTWFSIEIRYVSGDACEPEDAWTFTIAGNT